MQQLSSSEHSAQAQRFASIYQQQLAAQSAEEKLAVIKAYDDFLRDFPHDAVARNNRSDLLKQLGFYDLALRDAEQAVEIAPEFAMAWCNKSFILNALGRYKEGWRDYEWRWKTDVETFQAPNWPIPRWQGEAIGDAKLLIYAEQGLGDNIQFVRYALVAQQRGLNIVVVNHLPLERLLNANLAQYGIETSANGEAISGLQYYVPMMSLPHYFGTTLEMIPCPEGYLRPEADYFAKWQAKVTACSAPEKLKIGVMWTGSEKHHRNQERSLNFHQFAQLFALDAEFHCLQKVVSEEVLQQGAHYPNLHFWHDELADFSDTAGLVAQMDLVISVDTSVAHLAGAMGKTTWILLTYHPDFRWLIGRSDSPWYHSVRLFRQGVEEDWCEVVQQIALQLKEKIDG